MNLANDHSPEKNGPTSGRREPDGAISRWLLLPATPTRSWVFTRLRWGRALAVAGTACLVAWVLLVTAAFGYVRQRRGMAEIRWVDLAVPTHWGRYQAAVGHRQILTGLTLARDGKLRESLAFVRSGLTRTPASLDGRLLLARLLSEVGRPDAAQDTLLAGLPYHRANPRFLTALFGFLLQRQADDRVVAIARDLLRSSALPSDAARLAALAGATASHFRGNYDQADDFLRATPRLADSRDGRLLSAKIDWERGFRELALVELRSLASEFPDEPQVHAELVQHLRLAGLTDEARRASVAFQIARPTLPAPRIELLYAYHHDGDTLRVARDVEQLLRDFPADEAALVALADFAANSGNVALARQLTAHARAAGLAWEPHAFLTVEAQLVARDYRGALETMRALEQEDPAWGARYRTLLSSLQAVAYLGAGDVEASRLFLASFLGEPALRADNLVALANRFVALDAGAQARQILARAIVADPLNQAALTRLVELDLNLNRIDELPAHLQRLLTMRKPSPDILRVAQHKLGSDLFLFSRERTAVLAAVHARLAAARR